MDFALGLDVGGTFTKMVLVERPATVVAGGRVPTHADRGVEDLVARAVPAARELCAQNDRRLTDATAVGIGIAGLIDQRRGLLTTAPNLPRYDGQPVREIFARA